MHLSKFFLVLFLALLHAVASAPTSDIGPAPSEPAPEPSEPPEPVNPPPETTSRRETTPTPRATSSRAPSPPPPETSSTRETSSEPTSTEPPETSTTLTDTFSETTTSTPPATTSASASSPVGGGQTCVQACLAQAATNVGCNGLGKSHAVDSKRHTHFWTLSSSFMSNAESCFANDNCDSAAVSSATSDYQSVCDSLSTPRITPSTTPTPSRPPQPSITQTPVTRTPSPSRPPESTVSSVATFVIQSGAVITVSNSVYTAGGVVTTTFSGKMGFCGRQWGHSARC
ncbi:hypothetical protein RhiJN_12437 [Ceratobasidium sp. AG-Ba]|nr:hypothetical protein RhiJN_12437 [Ceratobasidium sp. AG-Ba]